MKTFSKNLIVLLGMVTLWGVWGNSTDDTGWWGSWAGAFSGAAAGC